MPRDKFAAMASRTSSDTGSAVPNFEADRETEPSSSPAEPARRDKLAAMASRSAPTPTATPPRSAAPPTGGRGNKFAAMASSTQAAAAAAENEEKQQNIESEEADKRLRGLKGKLTKRKHILDNLDRAEDLTCKLLGVAHQTTKSLEDLTCPQNISELSKTYRETLRELHPLLSTSTEELIHPYQNHSMETKQSMYAARVEMRLAKERTQVLKAITELEKSQEESTKAPESKKRPRE